jgi:NADH-quinone oxidoreductase subunit L
MVLALLAIVGGLVGPPLGAVGNHHPNMFQRWLLPVLTPIGGVPYEFSHASIGTDWTLILISLAVAVFGIWLAWRFYGRDPEWTIPAEISRRFPELHQIVYNKYYVDELYYHSVVSGTIAFSRALSWFDANVVDGFVNLSRNVTVYILGFGSSAFDKFIIDGAVNGVAVSARGGSTMLRKFQSGVVQNYALVMGGGIVLLALVYLFLKP